jgi:PTS system mannose-specific IIC component
MEITTLQIVLVFIVACIAGMESVLDEFQFHRPLVACTLIGAVLGDMKTGIIIGGTLEMIALGWMNIGAAVAPDAALAPLSLPFWLSRVIKVSAPVSRWLSHWQQQARY